MTENDSPTGLLTADEREKLTNSETDTDARDEIRERVADRLRESLLDFPAVYPMLRDEDVETVFCPDDVEEFHSVCKGTQSALGLLVLGMLTNDDLLETRVADAIRYAALTHGEEVCLDFTVRRSPLPSFESRLNRFEQEGLTMQNHLLYE